MKTSLTRLIAAMAIVLPAASLVASPVMAATHTKTATTKHHSVHKVAHKSHKKALTAPTAS